MSLAPGRGRRLVVRAPNHMGDVVMALPALAAVDGDIAVVRWLAPIFEMAGLSHRAMPFDRGWRGWWDMVGRLRERSYDRGVLMSPSFSAAWLLRCGGVPSLRGTATDGRTWLLADGVAPARLRGLHRVEQYRLLLGVADGVELPRVPLRPRPDALAEWQDRLMPPSGVLVGIVPGSNAPARRWPVDRFGRVAQALAQAGARVVVVGSPGERSLTRHVADAAPGSVDAGGETSLAGLAAILSMCHLVVTNDTGPMHLAAALGTPTVTLWGPSDPAEVRVVDTRDERVSGAELPCRPCFKNHCPRIGKGTLLPEAHEECMRLISVDRVVSAATRFLGGAAA